MAVIIPIISEWNAKGVNKAMADIQKAGSGFDKFSAGVGAASRTASIALGGLAVAGFAFAKAAVEDEKSAAVLAGSLKNLTNATEPQIAALEDFILQTSLATGVADDKLRPALNRLVRSTKDVNEAQDLMNLALDISAATGKDAESVANALAKANDGNVTALKKLGITLGDNATNLVEYNKENEKLSKLNIEASGSLQEFGASSAEYAKAQQKVADQQAKVNDIASQGIDVFGELQKEFDGAAETAAGTTAGSMARLTVAMNETKESIGAGLLPIIQNLTPVLSTMAQFIQRNSTLVTVLVVVFGSLAATIVILNYAIKSYTIITKTITAVTKLWAAAQLKLNISLTLNPIGLIVLAIAAFVAGVILAYKKSETFRNMVDSLFQMLKDVGAFIKNVLIGYFELWLTIIDKVKTGVKGIVDKLNPFKNFFKNSGTVTQNLNVNSSSSSSNQSNKAAPQMIVTDEIVARSISRILAKSDLRNGSSIGFA